MAPDVLFCNHKRVLFKSQNNVFPFLIVITREKPWDEKVFGCKHGGG